MVIQHSFSIWLVTASAKTDAFDLKIQHVELSAIYACILRSAHAYKWMLYVSMCYQL